ncbi:NPCBM/NEW2 domain-containing protein [Paenibacillus sp. UNC496MF]|uniref:stalk domain-containing protein n=1 Tax=Paenibacillus sp. UNC496MF TaxID=1502753 RepID=UPI0008EF3F9B|nr:stalk domain-containing protein [Paenibacillus sp. UNC496MF]SFJ44736.1 NPCBM/NEW2 domain-containing protein [Paenibacillus sp. UNC496MF]
MSKSKKFRLITGGFIVGALFFSGVSYASSNAKQINAFFGVKLIQNGIDKTPTNNMPFIVNGTTYVPLRTASELTGVDITWDGKNSSVIIGKKVVGTSLPVPSNIKKSGSILMVTTAQNQKMNINNKSYGNKGQVLTADNPGVEDAPATISYDLNAQYSKLILGVGMDDESYDATRTLTFKDQDGSVIKQVTIGKGSVQEGLELNVKGVLRLDIEISSTQIGSAVIDLINPVLT